MTKTTNWQKIYKKFKENGLNPYSVGQHMGKCTEPYTVIREGVTSPQTGTNKLGIARIEIILMIPYRQYTLLEPLRDKVKEVMREIDFVEPTGFESISTTDEKREATTQIIEYKIIKTLRRF